PGMQESRYITQHLVSGMGHLDKMNIQSYSDYRSNMAEKALPFLDAKLHKDYQDLKRYKRDLKKDNLSYIQVHYLYTRSFYDYIPVQSQYQEAFDYYKGQAEKYWLSRSKYMQGMIALALDRFDKKDSKVAGEIMESLRQNAVRNDEMGMYYKSNTGGWYWYQAPIETQALLIEAFSEVANDEESVEDLKVWLLKQKQTQDWKTTKATTEACYALLMEGTDWLAQDALVDITIGGQKIDPRQMPEVKVEAGTGYFKKHWKGEEVTADMANITVSKKDKGVSWGSVYWQYFEQLDKITPAKTPLALKKELFLEKITTNGKELVPLTEGAKINVGDKVMVRVELRSDRDMEYIHLKDMRASGFEPVNVLSQYKYQDGLGYYESTKDASTNFFIGYLRKGTYVFEYPLRASHKGEFSNGITSVQCMYAPEFTSHSEGIRVKID
ncbi:MAG: alpha-2-macroglobulin, partial [Chitinophagales bacterium]